MKLAFLVILLISASALEPEPTHHKNKDLTEFITALGKVFDYTVNDEIPKCFNDNNVEHLGYMIQALRHYSWTIRNGSFTGFVSSAVQSWGLTVALEKPLQCVWKTRDFKNLIKALKIDCKKMDDVVKLFFFFIDAYPIIASEIGEELWKNVEKREFEKAGTDLGNAIEPLLKEKHFFDVMEATAFINGIFLRNNIPAPDIMREKCIDGLERARPIVELYRKWAVKLRGVKEKEALVETIKYLGAEGFKWYKTAGIGFWSCVRESDDNKNFWKETRYDLNPYDMNFDFDLGTLLGREKFARRYLNLMKNMRNLLKKKNNYFLFGGIQFGGIIRRVSDKGVS